MISSSMIVPAVGLSWWESWICVWLGYTIAAAFVCLTGRIGATYHISFPVVSRASFGIWGALWPVFNRAAMACIWYGVQAWIGGECVRLMICAIVSDNWGADAPGKFQTNQLLTVLLFSVHPSIIVSISRKLISYSSWIRES